MRVSSLSKETLVHHYSEFDPRQDFRNINLVRLITSLVRGETVLDIGSGSGYLLNELGKQGKVVYGIEPLVEMIKIAKKRYPKLTIYQGHAEDIEKIFLHSVDTVVMTDVLEHIEDDKTQLIRIYKKLDKGGQIIIVVPAYQYLYGQRDKELGHYRRYSGGNLRRIVEDSGFSVMSLRYWNMLGIFPYFISEKILGKPFNTSLRSEAKAGLTRKMLQRILNYWFKHVENNINLGFGLSIICVGEKK